MQYTRIVLWTLPPEMGPGEGESAPVSRCKHENLLQQKVKFISLAIAAGERGARSPEELAAAALVN